jgi:hypothetical protein
LVYFELFGKIIGIPQNETQKPKRQKEKNAFGGQKFKKTTHDIVFGGQKLKMRWQKNYTFVNFSP